MYVTIFQLELTILELKKTTKMTNEQIFDFLIKTGVTPGSDAARNWNKEVTLTLEEYCDIIRSLVCHIVPKTIVDEPAK
jgi:hypothetical protein